MVSQQPSDAAGVHASMRRGGGVDGRAGSRGQADGTRREEILLTAASLFGSLGLRTSLQEIADAVGVLPGSLYHHFESKDAIFIELLRRYHAELDHIGSTAQAALDRDSRPVADRIAELGSAIATCAAANRAAVQMSVYEGVSTNPELAQLTHWRPVAIQDAMLLTLRVGRWSGDIRSDIDLPSMADRICQTMLNVGLDATRADFAPAKFATLLCRLMLNGLATREATDQELDRSNAMAAADEVIATWAEADLAADDDKTAYIRTVARAEFGRKGYESTTIRDIASAAGVGTRTVQRLAGSKEELLTSIMHSYAQRIDHGWASILGSDATPVEKLDALSWINVHALDRFSDEFRIQIPWLHKSRTDTPRPSWSYGKRVRQLKALLSEGIRSKNIFIDAPSTDMLARCIMTIQWIPEHTFRAVGNRAAHLQFRDTVLRGIANRA